MATDFPIKLDIMGQNPMLRTYTNISYVFASGDDAAEDAEKNIVEILTNGLKSLSRSFPWIAGQVTNVTDNQTGSSELKITPLDEIPRLRVAHKPQLSLDTLRQARWPMAQFDESTFASREMFSNNPAISDTLPVFLVQATFITGGLVLTFSGLHSTMDMMGQIAMIRLLHKACCGDDFTKEELKLGNRHKPHDLKLLESVDDETLRGLVASQIGKQSPENLSSNNSVYPEPPKFSWVYFQADNTSLQTVKTEATASVTSGFVSTDDVLTALAWQAISRARKSRLNDNTQVLLARAVDVRRFIGIPEDYPGLMQNMVYNTMTVKKLLDAPLGTIASLMRSKLDPAIHGSSTQVVMTLLDRYPYESPIPGLDPSQDVMVTSWAKMDCYNQNFNLGLGNAENVLRPRLPFAQGWINIMPMSAQHGVAVAVCLRDDDLKALRTDVEFTKYLQYIG